MDGPNNDINEKDLNLVSLIAEIPEEVAMVPSKKVKHSNESETFDTDLFGLFDSSDNISISADEDSGFSSEEESTFLLKSSSDEDFLDLFPSLSSV